MRGSNLSLKGNKWISSRSLLKRISTSLAIMSPKEWLKNSGRKTKVPHLCVQRTDSKVEFTVSKGTQTGNVDCWITIMKHTIRASQHFVQDEHNVWLVINDFECESRFSFWTQSTRSSESQNTFSSFLRFLGESGNPVQMWKSFATKEKELWELLMYYVDEVLKLMGKGNVEELTENHRNELLQKSIEVVENQHLHGTSQPSTLKRIISTLAHRRKGGVLCNKFLSLTI